MTTTDKNPPPAPPAAEPRAADTGLDEEGVRGLIRAELAPVIEALKPKGDDTPPATPPPPAAAAPAAAGSLAESVEAAVARVLKGRDAEDANTILANEVAGLRQQLAESAPKPPPAWRRFMLGW